MGEIVIRFDRFVLERMIYIIIILVLAILLVFSYIGDETSNEIVQEENNEQNSQLAEQESEEEAPETENTTESVVDATCSDGIQNQDETAVDCGGVCSTIKGEYFYDGSCHENPEPQEPELSGEISLDVEDVESADAPGNGTTALKVTEFTVSVENGIDDRFFGTIVAFVKTTSGTYLNQESAEYDEVIPYMGPYDLDKLEAGESTTVTFDDEGQYVREIPGYDTGDDFRLEIQLLDDDGGLLDEYVYTVRG